MTARSSTSCPGALPTPAWRRGVVSLAVCAGLSSACTTTPHRTETAGKGAVVGCVSGVAFAMIVRGNPLEACLAGTVVGGVAGYQKARLDELDQARETAKSLTQDIVDTPAAKVEVQQVQVVEADSGRAEKVEAFKGLSMDVPLSQLGTPEGQALMRKLDAYARKIAQDRGEPVSLEVVKKAPTETAATMPAQRLVLEETTEPLGKGLLIRRVVLDTALPSTVQRVKIETHNPASFLM
jgi:hypothetical protein